MGKHLTLPSVLLLSCYILYPLFCEAFGLTTARPMFAITLGTFDKTPDLKSEILEEAGYGMPKLQLVPGSLPDWGTGRKLAAKSMHELDLRSDLINIKELTLFLHEIEQVQRHQRLSKYPCDHLIKSIT